MNTKIGKIYSNDLKLKNGILNGVYIYFKENFGILIGLLSMCVILSIFSPAFATTENIMNVLRQVSTNANLAFGMTFAIIITGIDLSVGSILAVSGTVAAGLIARNGLPLWLAVLIGILVGTFLGFVNGFIVARTGMPYFIATLAMMQIARGAAYIYTNGMPIRTDSPAFTALGNGYFGPVPLPIIYSTVFLIGTSILLNKTKFGRYVYAVGGNRDAAVFSGINVKKIEIFVFTLIGFLCGVSGVVLCARMSSGQPTVGVGFELDAIAAVILGGTSFAGGIGKIGGTVIGVLVIGVLNNGLNLLNINSFWQLVAKGGVILLAVYVDILKKNKKK